MSKDYWLVTQVVSGCNKQKCTWVQRAQRENKVSHPNYVRVQRAKVYLDAKRVPRERTTLVTEQGGITVTGQLKINAEFGRKRAGLQLLDN